MASLLIAARSAAVPAFLKLVPYMPECVQDRITIRGIRIFLAASAASTTFLTAYAAHRGISLYKARKEIQKAELKRHDKAVNSEKCSGVDAKFVRRLRFLMGILLPPSSAKKDILRLLALACIVTARTYVSDRVARLNGRSVYLMLNRDKQGFVRLIMASLSYCVMSALLAPTLTYLSTKLAVSWRKRLTELVHSRYFLAMNYYQMSSVRKEVTDPDQRISQDINKLSKLLGDLFPQMVKPVVDISWFTFHLHKLTGTKGTLSLYGYMFAGFALLKAVTPAFGALKAREEELEGDFHFSHSRVRSHAESIAFYGGDDIERSVLQDRCDELLRHKRKVASQKWLYGIAEEFVSKQLPANVAWVMSLVYAVSADTTDPNFSETVRYLASVVSHSFLAVGELTSLYQHLNELSGYVFRVNDLLRHLDQDQNSGSKIRDGPALAFRDVTVKSPNGDTLIESLDFELAKGSNAIVTGPNGSGKTSLFRAVRGLWGVASGTIVCPRGERGFYHVPQKPYSVVGTLRDQVTYPERIQGTNELLDSRLRELLDVVNVGYLADRDGGWHNECVWEDTLSLGEQQRIGIARLLYHRPSVAALDECTSAVSTDIEEKLYLAAKDLGITIITLSQRLALRHLHDIELKLDGAGGWEVKIVQK